MLNLLRFHHIHFLLHARIKLIDIIVDGSISFCDGDVQVFGCPKRLVHLLEVWLFLLLKYIHLICEEKGFGVKFQLLRINLLTEDGGLRLKS